MRDFRKYRLTAFCLMVLLFTAAQPLAAQVDPPPVLDTVVASPDYDSASIGAITDEVEEQLQSEPEPDTTVYRSVPDSVTARLKKEKDFAYANDPDYWKKPEQKKKSTASRDFFEWLFSSTAVRFVMYFILAFILLFAVYRIVINNNLFFNPARKKAELQEEVKEEVDKNQLDALIAAAVKENDYRKAVRFYFLKTLFDLDARGLIRYHPEGTNHEYLMQMGIHAKAGEFSYLTQVYEYVWYGGFTLQPAQFEGVEQRFRQFLKSKNA